MAKSVNFSERFSLFSGEPVSNSPVIDFNLPDGTTLPPEIIETTGQTFEIASQKLRTQAFGESYAVVEGLADGEVEVEITPTADESGNGGVIFRRSDANNMFQFHVSPSATNRLRLVKVENGSNTVLKDFNVSGYDPLQTRTLKVVFAGDDIKLYLDGVFQRSEVSTFNQLATGVGIRSDRSTLEYDNFAYPTGEQVLEIAPNFLNNTVLSTGDVMVRNGVWDIEINSSGAITENVQYTINNGQTWVDFNLSAPNGLTHSAPLAFNAGEYDIKFRLEESGFETESTHLIVSRYVFLGKGQSNMAGFGKAQYSTLQQPETSTSGFRPWLIDKTDETMLMRQDWDKVTSAVDSVTYNEYANVGWMIRFANLIVTNEDEPVVCIPGALGGSTIAQNIKNSTYSSGGQTVYSSGTRRVNLTVGGCTLVLYQQGENDANDNEGTTKASYASSLSGLVDDHYQDYGVPTLIVALGNIHRSNYIGTGGDGDNDTGQVAIRAAQVEVAASNSNAFITEPLTDLILSDDGNADNVHFSTDTEFDAIANRTYATLTAITSGSASANQAPTANAGSNQSVDAGTRVTLNASGSTAGSYPIVSYEWTQTQGDSVSLIDLNTATPEFTSPSENNSQTLRFSVVPIDSEGNRGAADTVDITVAAFVFEGSVLQLIDTLAFELVTDGELMIYPGRANREILKLRPSDELGLVVDEDGCLDFEHADNDIAKLEVVIFNSTDKAIIDSDNLAIVFEGAEAHCRLGDFNPTNANEPFDVGVIVYIEGDSRGVVAYNSSSSSANQVRAYVQKRVGI